MREAAVEALTQIVATGVLPSSVKPLSKAFKEFFSLVLDIHLHPRARLLS
jgi:hypothetical protein